MWNLPSRAGWLTCLISESLSWWGPSLQRARSSWNSSRAWLFSRRPIRKPGRRGVRKSRGLTCLCVSHEDRQKSYSSSNQVQQAFYISHQLNEFVKRGGLLLTIWSTLILFIPRGGPENRPRTARISDTLGFSPLCTWKCTESQLISLSWNNGILPAFNYLYQTIHRLI